MQTISLIFALLALLPPSAVTELNLFNVDVTQTGKKSGLTRVSSGGKRTRCELPILKEFNKLNGTGAKAYKVSEKDIQLCPNHCDEKRVINKFCLKYQPGYVKALGADVKSDRCCDTKKCNCVCHFNCKTVKHKEIEFKSEGYHHCSWAKKKKTVLSKSRKICAATQRNLSCPSQNFLCPRQFFCLRHKNRKSKKRNRRGNGHTQSHGDYQRCLSCVNTNCVTKEDKKITEKLLTAKNVTEQEEYVERYFNREHRDLEV